MPRLIDADELMKHKGNCYDEEGHLLYAVGTGTIMRMPTIDAVPVVRCRECKHKVTTEDGEYNPRDIVCDYWESDGLEETDFCSYGERKTDE